MILTLDKLLDKQHNDLFVRIKNWKNEVQVWVFINIQISTCFSEIAPCKGSSYFPAPKKLNNLMKKLVNIKNEDEECFRWCLDKNSAIIRNIDREFAKQPYLEQRPSDEGTQNH